MDIPKLYVIADVEVLGARGVALREFAEGILAAGVRLVQLRDKIGGSQEVLDSARVLFSAFAGSGCRLVMNDRADLAVLAGFDGVHVGQGDLSPEDARVVGRASLAEGSGFLVGVSTHADEQVIAAEAGAADYVAIGPVFSTGTKLNAEPVVGLEGVGRARTLTTKPLVAIGGMTRENCRGVIEAGADSVAVISGLFAAGESVERVARDFLDILR